jgi:hypothetical protein
VYARAGDFADLPSTGVSHLQTALLDQRTEFLHDPAPRRRRRASARSRRCTSRSSSPPRSRPCCSALPRRVAAVVWALLALTVLATLYFGWHYVLDDVAGMAHRRHVARARAGADRLRAARPPAGACRPPTLARMTLLAERRPELEPDASHTEEPPSRREVLAGPIVAAVTLLVALVGHAAGDVPLRDPDHVAALYFVLVGCGVVVMVLLDIAIRAERPVARGDARASRRERWTRARCVAVGGGHPRLLPQLLRPTGT